MAYFPNPIPDLYIEDYCKSKALARKTLSGLFYTHGRYFLHNVDISDAYFRLHIHAAIGFNT
jgi:hypothetical protein